MKEENVERKELFSVKISTLVILFIILIVASLAIVKIAYSVEDEINDSKTAQEEPIAEKVAVVDANLALESKKRDVITSRASEGRAEIITIENGEEQINQTVEEIISVTTAIEDVKISVDMDLTVRTGLSRDDFIKLMADCRADTAGFFEENAGLIYDVCEKYSLNEVFFCGLISAESGWTIAPNHRRTHNYISLMSSGGLISFGSVEDGIEQAAKTLHDRYLFPGGSFYYGPTLAAMKTRFCPVSPTWVGLVFGRMQQIVK